MRRYDLGDTASLRHVVRDADGTPVDATVVLTIVLPDGTTDEPVLTSNATGTYDGAYEVPAYGRYSYRWDVSGAVNDVVRGNFYVDDDDDRLPPLASFDNLARKLGYTPEDAERDRAEDCLDAASELIRDAAGKTWTDEDTAALIDVPRRVRTICVEAAARGFRNPEGLSQRTIGDSSKSFDRAGREGGEAVYLTSEEERAVRKAASGSTLTSVTLVSPYSYDAETEEVLWS
jgi:hypothetical protein